MTDRMQTEAGPAVEAMIGQIEAMLEAAGSLDELRAMLTAAFPNIDASDLARVMAEGFMAAHAAGRVAVLDEEAADG